MPNIRTETESLRGVERRSRRTQRSRQHFHPAEKKGFVEMGFSALFWQRR